MDNSYVWTPTPEQVERSNVWQFMKRHGIEDYSELIRRSTSDTEWFWDAVIGDLQIEFFESYRQLLDTTRGIAWSRWFVGGKLNLVHNCVDKHAKSRRCNKAAVLWEGESGAIRRLTYAQLFTETNRLANALKRIGIGRGDRVGIFMPMLPETVTAFMACVKLGSIVVPIFSGFGAQAVADRLNDCETKLLITVDGFARRGSPIDAHRIADEAVRHCPTVQHILVLQHIDRGSLMRPGFELWWHELVRTEAADCSTEVMDSEDPFMIAYTSGT